MSETRELPTQAGYYLSADDDVTSTLLGLLLLSVQGGWFILHSAESIEGAEGSEGVYRPLTPEEVEKFMPLVPIAKGKVPPRGARFRIGQRVRVRDSLSGYNQDSFFEIAGVTEQDWGRTEQYRPRGIPEGESRAYYTDRDGMYGVNDYFLDPA